VDREKGAKEMLSGCVAVVWQNRLGSIERLNDPTVERRQPSMILSLRARSVRALELFCTIAPSLFLRLIGSRTSL